VTATQSVGTASRCHFCDRRGTECVPVLCDRCGRVRCPSRQSRGMCVVCQPSPAVADALGLVVAERVRAAIESARVTIGWRRGA